MQRQFDGLNGTAYVALIKIVPVIIDTNITTMTRIMVLFIRATRWYYLTEIYNILCFDDRASRYNSCK